MNEKIIIIDGNAIIHRSFHALPSTMKTRDGLIINAAYGFASFLIKALGEIKPSYAVLTLDKKAPTFRHLAYSEYKAKRVKAPQELYDQIPIVKKIAEAFSLPIFELDGYEADDLIGTIAQKINTENPKIEVIIISGDLDTLQLVNKKTKIYTMSKGLSETILYDEEKIQERFSLSAKQIVDFKSLKGDPSDNIPGVTGIGEKTATDLLTEFKNLEEIYRQINSPKIKERTRELLIKYKDQAYLSKDLSIIKTDAPINFEIDQAKIKNLDKNKINEVFSELEFKSLLSRVLSLNINKEEKQIDKFERNKKLFKYFLINTEKDFENFFQKIKDQKIIAVDTETDSLDSLNANLLGISFCFKEGEAYFVSLKNLEESDNLFGENKEKAFLKKIKEILENEKIEKIGHNIKYDIQVLENYKINISGKIFDTMIASYLLNPESRQHSLDNLSYYELNWEKIKSEELFSEKEKIKDFSKINIEKLAIYSCEDVDFTFKLKNKLEKKLKEKDLIKLFEELEMPLVKTISEIERNGILLNCLFLKKLNANIKNEIKKISEKIWKIAGENFNINSTKQLKEILYEKLKIENKGLKKTKTGLSTASEELEKIKDLHPIIELIQEYRELNKLNSTYIESLPKLIDKKDKKLHTSFNQTITATGRLSSSKPNLQNIPTKTELGNTIRKAFIAENGYKLLSLDYSQIELRIMAHLSKDKNLLQAFLRDIDVHKLSAANINKIKIEDVDEELRQQAKAINFGILYGQGPHGLSQSANIPYQQAREFIKKYFEVFSGVDDFIKKTIENTKKSGYTETILGRKREIKEINSPEIKIQKGAERMAINSPIQGSAADIIKLAMIKIFKEIKNNPDIKMILQIHDELIFEVKENKADHYYKKIKEIMENIIKLDIPLLVEAYVGDNWGEMEKIKNG